MASNTDSLNDFFIRTIDGLAQDAASKQQKIPISSLRYESDEITGTMYAADYFKYLIYGRGPGKAPPPDNILVWVQGNPDALARARQVFKYITEKGLAYIIGQKIAKEGTDIYSGKKEGIDLLGVMEKNMPSLLEALARNEIMKIATDLRSSVK
jgi:hypothetical protein